MKTLIVLFFGVCFSGFGITDTLQNEPSITDLSEAQEIHVVDDYCKLTMTGFANFSGMRVKLTLSAEAETCVEAAAEMRTQIIDREIRIAY